MKRKMFLLALVMLALTACGGGSKRTNAPAVLESVPAEYAGKTNPGGDATQGAAVFAENCAACHGEKGDGNSVIAQSITPPPANLVELQKKAGDDYLFWRISTGKPGTSMAPWNHLGEDQIWNLVAYIRTLK